MLHQQLHLGSSYNQKCVHKKEKKSQVTNTKWKRMAEIFYAKPADAEPNPSWWDCCFGALLCALLLRRHAHASSEPLKLKRSWKSQKLPVATQSWLQREPLLMHSHVAQLCSRKDHVYQMVQKGSFPLKCNYGRRFGVFCFLFFI